jgi:hypothetical protein
MTAVCGHCQRRKAKRKCPGLGADLCPLCCGLLREKSFYCPPRCPHLARHRPYQEKKIIQKKQTFSQDIVDDERLRWLILNIEASLQAAAADPDYSDKDAILALEYAKEKVEKGKPRLLVSEDPGRPRNELGEAVYLAVEQSRYERQIILPQAVQAYQKEEKVKCLEQVILAVKHTARTNLGSRTYLEELNRRFARLKDSSPSKKIISPA